MSGCGARTAAGSLEAVFELSDVERFPSTPLPVPGVGRPRWQLELIRCRAIEGDQEVMRRKRIDPKARGLVCAVKRANVNRARDQRTTSGPAGASKPASTGRRHDRTHDQTHRRKITLDQRAPSLIVSA